jgi:hypothetical protein
MEMEAGMFRQPLPNCRMLAGAVVVADQIDFFSRVLAVEDFQEG